MKKLIKYLGLIVAGVTLLAFLLLLTPAATGLVIENILGGTTIDVLNPALNGFAMIFGGTDIAHGSFDYDVKLVGVGVAAFVLIIVSLLLAIFIVVNSMLKKPLVKLSFPVFWTSLAVLAITTGVLMFVTHAQVAAADWQMGPAFILCGVFMVLVGIAAGFRAVLKVLKKA